MTPSKAHQRSLTISIRTVTPAPPIHTQKQQGFHKPTKSTPNAMALAVASPFPGLSSFDGSSLPRHNRDLTLQRYLLLQEEHESIRRHMDELSTSEPSSAETTATTTRSTTSPALSPTRASAFGQYKRRTSSGSGAFRPRCHGQSGRRGASDPEMAVDPARLAEMLNEEARLCSINEGIKRSLTELLNCETVRCDQAFRQWIMSRLLEVEKELRSGRRRRSPPE